MPWRGSAGRKPIVGARCPVQGSACYPDRWGVCIHRTPVVGVIATIGNGGGGGEMIDDDVRDILKAMAWDCRWGPAYSEWTCTSYDVDYCRSLKNLPDVKEIVDHLQCMCPCHLPDGERLWAVKERMT